MTESDLVKYKEKQKTYKRNSRKNVREREENEFKNGVYLKMLNEVEELPHNLVSNNLLIVNNNNISIVI
jgi:hypothetical protein